MSSGKAPIRRVHHMIAAAVAQASDAGVAVIRAPFAGTVAAAAYVPSATITGVATNTRKLELVNKGQSGAGTTVAASIQFDNGINATAFDEKALTLSGTAGNLVVAAGDVLAWVSTHLASGIADPGGLVIVELVRD